MTGKTMTAAILALAIAIPAGASAQKATPTPTTTPTGTPVAAMTVDEFYTQVDANGDGRVTRAELTAFGAKHSLGNVLNARTWKLADKNKNGWLSKDEFVRYADRRKR